jgi:hypothetical protein
VPAQLQRFRNWCRPKPRTFSWFSPKENHSSRFLSGHGNCETALVNKDEEGGDCNGRKHYNDQGCIEQIPDWKIFIFNLQFLDLALAGSDSIHNPLPCFES